MEKSRAPKSCVNPLPGNKRELLTATIDGDTGSATNTDYYKLTATYGFNLANGLILPHSIKMIDSTGRTLSEDIRYYDDNTDNAVTDGFLTKKRQCIDLIYAAGKLRGKLGRYSVYPRGARIAREESGCDRSHPYLRIQLWIFHSHHNHGQFPGCSNYQYTTTDTLDYRLRVIEIHAPKVA